MLLYNSSINRVNINFNINSFFYFILFFSPVDEEKMDERAKMSVAAKRSLFRVSNLCSIHLFSEITHEN